MSRLCSVILKKKKLKKKGGALEFQMCRQVEDKNFGAESYYLEMF